MNTEYISKDQNYQGEATIYWFHLEGFDDGTNREIDDSYGVCESGGEIAILNCDGIPMTRGDYEEIAARRHCIVTDEMRAI